MDKVSRMKTSEARRGYWDWSGLSVNGWTELLRSVKFWMNIFGLGLRRSESRTAARRGTSRE